MTLPLKTPLCDQLIEATAGAGKTTLLVSTYIQVFHHYPQILPKHVLALTFTKLAAKEMLERVQAKSNQVNFPPNLAQHLHQCRITTIHSFCYDLLNQELSLPKRKLIEPEGQHILIHRAIQKTLESLSTAKDPVLLGYLRTHKAPQLIGLILQYFSQVKRLNLALDLAKQATFSRLYTDPLSSRQTSESQQAFVKLGHIFESCWTWYCTLKQQAQSIDYDDLLDESYQLLRQNHSLRHQLQDMLRYILVDEFQDTHQNEWQLIQLLCADSGDFGKQKLFVVGDRWQAIYGFRGNDTRLFESLIQHAPLGTHQLKQDNYRSHPDLIAWLNIFFGTLSQSDTLPFRPLIAKRKASEFSSQEAAVALGLFDSESNIQDQINWLIADIKQAISQNCSYESMAIILRKRRYASVCQEQLNRANIPNQLKLGLCLFKEPIVVRLCCLLGALYQPYQLTKCVNVLCSPWVNFPHLALHHLKAKPNWWHQDQLEPMLSTLLSKGIICQSQAKNTRIFASCLATFSAQAKFKSPRFLLESVLDCLVIEEEASQLELLKQGLAQLDAWWQQSARHAWLNLLDIMDYHLAQPTKSVQTSQQGSSQGVHILTIHAAKGLEFDRVYVLDLDAGFNFDYANPLLIDAKHRVAYSDDGSNHPLRQDIQRHYKHNLIKEEQRLFYVACTRAKQQLRLLGRQPKRKSPSILSMLLEHSSLTQSHCHFEFKNDCFNMPLLTPQTPDLAKPQTATGSQLSSKGNKTLSPNIHSTAKLKTPAQSLDQKLYTFQKIGLRESLDIKGNTPLSKQVQGSQLHSLIEQCIKYPHLAIQWPNNTKLSQTLEAFCASDFFLDLLCAEQVLIEEPIVLIQDQQIISGRIDVAYYSNQTWHIIDFKKRIYHANDYKAQLLLYAKALEQRFGTLSLKLGVMDIEKLTLHWFKPEQNT